MSHKINTPLGVKRQFKVLRKSSLDYYHVVEFLDNPGVECLVVLSEKDEAIFREATVNELYMLQYHAACKASLTQQSTAAMIEKNYPHLFKNK